MNTGSRLVKTKEVFCNCIGMPSIHLSRLNAGSKSGSHCRAKGWIFTICLTLTSHPRVTCYIQHRRKGMGNPHRLFLPSDNPAYFLFQLRVPSGSAADSCREAGGSLKQRAAKSFHMEDCRNVVRTVIDDKLLIIPLESGTFLRCFQHPHFKAAYLTDTQCRILTQFFKIICATREDTGQLCHFFFCTHSSEEISGTGFR